MFDENPIDEKKQVSMSQKDRILVLRHIMEGPVGREWVWDLLAECKIFNSTINQYHVMCALEGGRRIGLRIFNDIQSDPELRKKFNLAQEEHISRTEENKNG